MVTILLEQIISLLKGFFGDFTSWAADVFEKLGFIQEQTENLDDILVDTTNISNNSNSIAASNEYIKSNAIQINNKLTTIQTNSTTIANNSGSIATSAGTAAAFAEDCATNTLNINNRLVTIGSDTTQIRADTTSLAADVAEIKDTLGLYLYNTIVTEDAEGDIASCDTDLKDYLQEAKVTIPADANGITDLFIVNQNCDPYISTCFKGLLEGTFAFVDLGSLTWSRILIPGSDSIYGFYSNTMAGVTKQSPKLACPIFEYKGSYSQVKNFDKSIGYVYLESIIIRDDDYIDATDFKTAMNGIYMIYELKNAATPTITKAQFESLSADFNAPLTDYEITFTSITDGAEIDLLTGLIKINTSPVTYDSITPIAIRTYKGINNFYSDIGTTSVTYRETLKHYLKKQEA